MSRDNKNGSASEDSEGTRKTSKRYKIAPTTLTIAPGAENRPVMPFQPPPPAPRRHAENAPPIVPSPMPQKSAQPAPAGPSSGATRVIPAMPPIPDKGGVNAGVWRRPAMASAIDEKPPAPRATPSTAVAFSNEAAGTSMPMEAGPTPTPQPVEIRAPRPEGIDFIGFDASVVPRIRKHPVWKKILADVQTKAKSHDDESREKSGESKDRRDVFAILMRGEPTPSSDLNALISEAMENHSPPPLVLLSGELEFLFDELETLKATLAIVSPFVARDEKLKEAIGAVRDVLATPGIERARGVMDTLCMRVRDAFGEKPRGVPANYIETQTGIMLLEGRCFQKRTLMGKDWIRASFVAMGDDKKAALPAYVGVDLATELPLFRAFSARLVAEVRPRIEQAEAAEIAVKVVGLGRRMGK